MDEYIENVHADVFSGRTKTAGVRIHINAAKFMNRTNLSDDPVSYTDIAFWDSCCNRDFYEYYFVQNLVWISDIYGMLRYFVDIADCDVKKELFISALVHLRINSVSVWTSRCCTEVYGYDVGFVGIWHKQKRRGVSYKRNDLRIRLAHYGFCYCGSSAESSLWTLYLQFIKNE